MIASSNTAAQAPARIRSACTVVLVRDSSHGPEVLLLRRTPSAAFLGGYDVFPGGALSREDHDDAALGRIRGLEAARANARLAVSEGALAFWLAAVRETFEECGILLVCDQNGAGLSGDRVAELAQDRAALNAGTRSFVEWMTTHELFVDAGAFAYFDHWLTPADRPRRFDTRFFMVKAPHGQAASPDGDETVAARWIRPAEALSLAEAGGIQIATATRATLRRLESAASGDEALAAARALATIEMSRPLVAQGRAGRRTFHDGEAQYHEILWCDPDESTKTTYDLVAGEVKQLDRWVARLVAPNPGPMTGPGTNTYFVGDRALAIIDPGPLDDRHLAAILAHAGGRIRWILCTHAHHDHSPAAARLARATGAQLIGIPPPVSRRHDQTFVPDRTVADGESLQLGDVVLRTVHTPGHAPNHVCFQLAATGMLFTGDHVMQGSTVVIAPPEGDMRDYLASLRRLLMIEIPVIAPGHGYLIGAAHREVRSLVEHRLWREARVAAALERHRDASVEALVDDVYPDLRPVLRPAAMQSLRAHLIKLVQDGRARATGDRFQAL